MEEFSFIDLKDRQELEKKAAAWFHEKWYVPTEAYLECMDAYLAGDTDLGWYLCLRGGEIVAGLGVIENDFHDRKDLTPNICAVYTEEAYRRRGIAGRLLDTAVEELRKKGFRTMLTHNGEYFPEEFNYDGNNKFHPDERVVYMNYVSPDYIVSVHVNSAGNANACGTIVFYNSTSSSKWNDWSEPAAEYIAEAIDACVEINASTKIENELTFDGASFAVTRDTHAAACLIEMGYVTNYDDAQDMLNEVWQRSMAEGIALGIARFFDSLET